jgi:hypothetical protein
MSFNYPMALCGFLLGLSGCAVAPIAQVAVSQIAPGAASCQQGSDCGGTLGKWTATVSDALGGKR